MTKKVPVLILSENTLEESEDMMELIWKHY